jgi:DNA-binding GntR family transcriptional regulator
LAIDPMTDLAADIEQPPVSRRRIYDRLRDEIARAKGRLPSERQLSDVLKTTRITLREALAQFEAEGLVYREQKRGWFVSPPRLVYNPLHRSHFERIVRDQGRVPSTMVLSSGLMRAPAGVARALGLGLDGQAFGVLRVRSIDKRRVLYSQHYLRPEWHAQMQGEDLTTSLTEIFRRKFGITLARVHFDIMPTALVGDAAASLLLAEGSPALLLNRINSDQNGNVVDCDVEYWRHDAILVRVEATDRS